MIKAVIFDCFGVLIGDGLSVAMDELDKSRPDAREFIMEALRANNSGLILPVELNQKVADYLGMAPDVWREKIEAGQARNPKVLELVKETRHQYKTALLSNVGKDSLHLLFTKTELDDLFDVVIASGEVGVMKPHPDIYELTADKLGVQPEECIFIDDREGHVQGANEVGMHGIQYENFAQTSKDLDSLLSS